MSLVVVDASVVVKWFVPEVETEAAQRLLQGEDRFMAPDLLFAEVANTVWKKIQRGELRRGEGRKLLAAMLRAPVASVPCRDLAADAYAIAVSVGHRIDDCLYLALALRLDTVVVTADRRLEAAMRGRAGMEQRIRHVASWA